MPLDSAEGINDAIAAAGVGLAILNAVKALPPAATRKAVDYAPILDMVRDKVLPLIDQVEADIKS